MSFNRKYIRNGILIIPSYSAGQIEGVCQQIMAGSSDLIGVASYLLDEFAESGGKCYDLSYDGITGVLLDTNYNGNISECYHKALIYCL